MKDDINRKMDVHCFEGLFKTITIINKNKCTSIHISNQYSTGVIYAQAPLKKPLRLSTYPVFLRQASVNPAEHLR